MRSEISQILQKKNEISFLTEKALKAVKLEKNYICARLQLVYNDQCPKDVWSNKKRLFVAKNLELGDKLL